MKHRVHRNILLIVHVINPWSSRQKYTIWFVGKKFNECVRKIGVPAPLNSFVHHSKMISSNNEFACSDVGIDPSHSFSQSHTIKGKRNEVTITSTIKMKQNWRIKRIT